MRLLFIGHNLHLKSRSSDFFVRFLEGFSEIRCLFVLPESCQDAGIIDSLDFSSFDAVILWQVDFLSPFFLSRGCPTVVVPMLDASAGLPGVHWASMKGSLVVSFSRDIHLLASRNGVCSIYVRYFPPVSEYGLDQVDSIDDSLSLFFWERDPSSDLNAGKVVKIFSGLVDRIHIHQAADHSAGQVLSHDELMACSLGAEISCSSWFSDREALNRLVLSSQFYVAPRLCEGIGHSFLEAMAAGRLVVAHRAGTHSDYILRGRNGYLVDFQKKNPSSFVDFSWAVRSTLRERLAVDARRYATAWNEFYLPCLRDAIVDYVQGFSDLACVYDVPFPAVYCFAAHQDMSLYAAMLEVWRHPKGKVVRTGRSAPLGWGLEALQAYGFGAEPIIKDMLRRPLVAEDWENCQSLTDLLSRISCLRSLPSDGRGNPSNH